MLRLANISKTYRLGLSRIEALKGASLEVNPGESVAIVGPSGSGKSTMLHIAGLMDEADEGTITLDGRDLTHAGARERALVRRDRLGFVFQSFHLIPVLNVLENVCLPASFRARLTPELEGRARALLAEVGLEGLADRPIAALSGGQRQRVALARALINRPDYLFADEPTANLDAASGEQVTRLLFESCARWNTALVLVTHDERLAARAGRRLHVADGRISQ